MIHPFYALIAYLLGSETARAYIKGRRMLVIIYFFIWLFVWVGAYYHPKMDFLSPNKDNPVLNFKK